MDLSADQYQYEMWSEDKQGNIMPESLWQTPDKALCQGNVNAMNSSKYCPNKTYFTMEVKTTRKRLRYV